MKGSQKAQPKTHSTQMPRRAGAQPGALGTMPPAQQQQKLEVDSLWYTRCAVPTASSLAFQHGWLQQSFAELGISLASVRAAEGSERAREPLHEQSAPTNFARGGNVPAIWARDSLGQPTSVVGITWVDEFQAIVTRRHSDVRGVQQLRARRLGLPRHDGGLVDHGRASALHGFISALKVADIDKSEVTLRGRHHTPPRHP